jgi:hypothetical protein
MSKAIVVKSWKQHAKIKVIQSPNVIVTTIRVETISALSTNAVRGGILIGSATNLGSGSGGILEGRNLSWSSRLPTTTTEVVGTPHMVFTNPIMNTHANKTTNRPSMSSMAT